MLASAHASGNTDMLQAAGQARHARWCMIDRDDHPTRRLPPRAHRRRARSDGWPRSTCSDSGDGRWRISPARRSLHAKRRETRLSRRAARARSEAATEWIVRAGFMEADGYRAMKRLLARRGRAIDAVFAANDPAAIGAMKAVWEAGLQRPERHRGRRRRRHRAWGSAAGAAHDGELVEGGAGPPRGRTAAGSDRGRTRTGRSSGSSSRRAWSSEAHRFERNGTLLPNGRTPDTIGAMISRRDFIATIGATGAATVFSRHAFAAVPAGDIKFGYAAITWEGDDLKAIEEVAAVGFKGIQLRSPIIEKFGDKPARAQGSARKAPSDDGGVVERKRAASIPRSRRKRSRSTPGTRDSSETSAGCTCRSPTSGRSAPSCPRISSGWASC